MNLSLFCGTNLIELELCSETKKDILKELADLLNNSEKIKNKEAMLTALLAREKTASTGMGFGIALPHARVKGVQGMVIAFGRSEKGIDFDSLDGKPVHLFFAIVVPETSINTHINALEELSKILADKRNRDFLLNATFPQEVLDLIDKDREIVHRE